jgi:hypothetical protein
LPVKIELVKLTKILNSAQGVILPILPPGGSPSALTTGASEKALPIDPPMILTPFTHSATSGNVANRRAAFVRVPVAIKYAVFLGVAIRALRAARMALSVFAETAGVGRREVPSIPLSPIAK